MYVFSGNFIYFITVSLVTILYSEILFGIFFKNIWKQLKSLTISSTKNTLSVNSLNLKILNITHSLLLIFLFTLKSSNCLLLLPVVLVNYIIKNIFIKNSNHMLAISTLFILSLFFVYINNFITFFIFLELYSITFYFYLLNQNTTASKLLIKYKNNLLLYLFNNFIISVLFMFFISHIVYVYGTVNFSELQLFNNSINNYFVCLILSIITKLSLPGAHYLKIEIYKYVSFENVVVFSVVTLFVNFVLINFLTNINVVYNTLNSYKIIVLLIPIAIIIIMQKLKINTFNEFIAYSGFATNNLILLNFIV